MNQIFYHDVISPPNKDILNGRTVVQWWDSLMPEEQYEEIEIAQYMLKIKMNTLIRMKKEIENE